MKRGRKTQPVLSLVPGNGRPKPPPGLDAIEQRVWNEVVNALPDYWLDSAGQLVLRRLAVQAAVCERCEERLRALRARNRDGTEDAAKLATMHAASAKAMTFLLTQLRATPRSRMVSRAAGPAIGATPARRPWEITAESEDEVSLN